MKGKQRCKILKEIRRQIAENNDIEYVVSECKHQGDCLGTCPKCEAEVRYLERELERRRKLGMAVTVAGLAVMMTASSVACDTANNEPPATSAIETTADVKSTESTDVMVEKGEIAPPDTDEVELGGEPLPPESEEIELGGAPVVDIPGEIVPPESEEIELGGAPLLTQPEQTTYPDIEIDGDIYLPPEHEETFRDIPGGI